MPGSGRTHKEFYYNIGKESSFKGGSSNYLAMSGPLKEYPPEELGYEPLSVPKGDQLGKNHQLLQGAFAGKIGFSYPLVNWRPFFRIMGGLIEYERIFVLSSPSLTFQDEIVTGSISGATAQATGAAVSTKLTLYQFTQGETVTEVSGDGSGTLDRIEGDIMYIRNPTGVWSADSDVLGSSSGARANISVVSGDQLQLTLKKFQDAETATGTTSGATGVIDNIFYSHYIFAWRDTPSYATQKVLEDMDVGQTPDESPLTTLVGMVKESLVFDVVSKDVPSVKEAWLISNTTDSDSKPTKLTNATTTIYEWTSMPSSGLLVNAIDYSGLFKTLNIEIKRDLGQIHGNSRNPVAIKGAELEFILKIGIHRQDILLRNMVRTWGSAAGAPVPGVFTFNRGTSGEDSAVITFSTLRLPNLAEKVGDKTILQECEFGVEGTPTIQTYDEIQYYGN